MCSGTLCNLKTIEVSESSMVWTVMAVFEQDFRYCLQPCVPYSEIDTDVQMINQFAEPNASIMGNFEIADFSVDSLSGYQPPDYQAGLAHNLPGTSRAGCLNELPILVHTNTSPVDVFPESKKRKVRELSTSSSDTFLSTASRDQLKDNSSYAKKNSPEQGKKKSSEKLQNKLDEVIHVRAKRGQATDSHSLAERVRRQKINNKLRCLQDLVPGCHKTMGMAAMLDEIINYVYSLKNQVEFLSTELEAACSLDLFSYTEATEEVKGKNPLEAHKMEIWEREQYGEQTRFHSTWPL